MTVFANILIFQPAAIGDVMLATPVAKALKHQYPNANISFWSHTMLGEILISMCPYIDRYISYEKVGIIELLKTFRSSNCDLFIDLSNSTRGKIIRALSGSKVRTLAYKKQGKDAKQKLHASENFLQAIEPIAKNFAEEFFPTIFPELSKEDLISSLLTEYYNYDWLAIVPGVGNQRPHRAWSVQSWKDLIRQINEKYPNILPVLIGGKDELDLLVELNCSAQERCLNLIGKLSLAQTAALLKMCKVVISGDTGPAHIAVAVGTPVIGLYGPTYSSRSGPYGANNLIIDKSEQCQCHAFKSCQYAGYEKSGQCMNNISAAEIFNLVSRLLPGRVISN